MDVIDIAPASAVGQRADQAFVVLRTTKRDYPANATTSVPAPYALQESTDAPWRFAENDGVQVTDIDTDLKRGCRDAHAITSGAHRLLNALPLGCTKSPEVEVYGPPRTVEFAMEMRRQGMSPVSRVGKDQHLLGYGLVEPSGECSRANTITVFVGIHVDELQVNVTWCTMRKHFGLFAQPNPCYATHIVESCGHSYDVKPIAPGGWRNCCLVDPGNHVAQLLATGLAVKKMDFVDHNGANMCERIWAPELQGVDRFRRRYEAKDARDVSEFMMVASVAGDDPRVPGSEIIHEALVEVVHQRLCRRNVYS